MQSKKLKEYENRDEFYHKQNKGSDIQGVVIHERSYGESINYSKLLSDIDEEDFVDSLLEDDIFHLRRDKINDSNLPRQDDKKFRYIQEQIESEKKYIFEFEKQFYP